MTNEHLHLLQIFELTHRICPVKIQDLAMKTSSICMLSWKLSDPVNNATAEEHRLTLAMPMEIQCNQRVNADRSIIVDNAFLHRKRDISAHIYTSMEQIKYSNNNDIFVARHPITAQQLRALESKGRGFDSHPLCWWPQHWTRRVHVYSENVLHNLVQA